jgi:DUF971 family protein
MLYPVHLFQISRYTFQVDWSDGKSTQHQLCDLQKKCPCKFCKEGSKREVDPLLLAEKISVIGQYGLKIEFTSGCNHGIYSFEYLRKLAEKND